jgi:hypothetical protein
MLSSHLYFILNPSLGLIKIGIADDVQQRHQGLEHACGVPLDILGILPDGGEFEHALHDAFYDDRLLGEWFSPSEELCALADDPSGVQEFIEAHKARIESNRQLRFAARSARLQESRAVRSAELQASRRADEAEREERHRVAILAAHEMAIREDRRLTRKAAKEVARAAAFDTREMETTIANYQNSSRVVERLLARELVAAADDRKSTLAKINSQRLRNAAFAGVRRAGAR